MSEEKILIVGNGCVGDGRRKEMATVANLANQKFGETMNKDTYGGTLDNVGVLDTIESMSTMLNNSFGLMPYGMSYGNYQTEREKRDSKNSQRSSGARAFKRKKAKNKIAKNSKKKNRG